MTDEEWAIINLMKDPTIKYNHKIHNFIQECMNAPFNTVSAGFVKHPEFKKNAEYHGDMRVKLWALIIEYLNSKNDSDHQWINLEKILREKLKKRPVKYVSTRRERLDLCLDAGIQSESLRKEFNNQNFFINLYGTKDKKLIGLFKELLPAPRTEFFQGQALPEFYAEKELAETKSILTFLKKHSELNEGMLIKAQRKLRGKRRQQEERERIAIIYEPYLASSGKSAADLLKEANSPYIPQGCNPALAARIVLAASEVKLFTTIRHLTSAKSLKSIMDKGLYGQRTLKYFNIDFVSAALGNGDVQDGDGNVICFGPNKIDPTAINALNRNRKAEITLDLNKAQQRNPCAFYKQRDLGWETYSKKTVTLGDTQLVFSPNASDYNELVSIFSLYSPVAEARENDGQIYRAEIARATLPKCLFIAYDMERMHQILTLNFFRFIDALQMNVHAPSNAVTITTEDIYAKIAALDDEALRQFLYDIGRLMTETMEYNFYGAYKMDFESILTIKTDDYCLNLSDLIVGLNSGDFSGWEQLKVKLPELASSYCFIDYLSSKVLDDATKTKLKSHRETLKLPFWLEMKEKNISDDVALREHYRMRQT
ncbi:MAG: hypothetical protein P4M14_00205 [Gammaproteobacteria bacterium]|nr:hypothetical protein [Gammaproteobacteria bacterium]